MPRLLSTLKVVLALAVPLFIVCASVTWATNDLGLYGRGFDKYHIESSTGIERKNLMDTAAKIRGYFNSRHGNLELRVPIYGQEQSLFSRREIDHMEDVKSLIWGVYAIGGISALLILLISIVTLAWKGTTILPQLAVSILWGSGLTISVIIGIGIFVLAAFDQAFLLFHRISFANELWQLNPRHHYLIRIFPEGFWFDAALFVGTVSIGLSLVLAFASASYLIAQSHSKTRLSS